MRRAIAAATLAASGLLAPAVHGAIVPNRSIAGVAIGMTQAKVRAVLGPPLRVIHRSDEIAGTATEFRYRRLAVTFASDVSLTAVHTTRTREHTRRGVGVGSSEADVTRLVGNVTCATEFGRRGCHTGELLPGARITVFDIRYGEVWRVRVGVVVD
jgi:hypothetical protein